MKCDMDYLLSLWTVSFTVNIYTKYGLHVHYKYIYSLVNMMNLLMLGFKGQKFMQLFKISMIYNVEMIDFSWDVKINFYERLKNAIKI